MFEKMARDEAEIERLEAEKDNLIRTYKECMTDVITEFAERLKQHMCSYDLPNYHYFKAVDEDTLDEVLKEMTEGSK
jgi:hypothetical protein